MPQKADFVKKPLFYNSAEMTILIPVFTGINMSKINIHRIKGVIKMWYRENLYNQYGSPYGETIYVLEGHLQELLDTEFDGVYPHSNDVWDQIRIKEVPPEIFNKRGD